MTRKVQIESKYLPVWQISCLLLFEMIMSEGHKTLNAVDYIVENIATKWFFFQFEIITSVFVISF